MTVPASQPSARPPPPRRGTPGGWRDPWDDPDDHAALRERLAAFDVQTVAIAAAWRSERHREARRQRQRRGFQRGDRAPKAS